VLSGHSEKSVCAECNTRQVIKIILFIRFFIPSKQTKKICITDITNMTYIPSFLGSQCSPLSKCCVLDTRQRVSVLSATLGKMTKIILFIRFFIPSIQTKICITDIIDMTYIPSTTHIYHRHHIHITNVTCVVYHNKFTSNPSAPLFTIKSVNKSTINNYKYNHGQRDIFGEGFVA
jgi:hypothetical protein